LCDVLETFVPDSLANLLGGQPLLFQYLAVHAHDQPLFVVRAVEYPDTPALRQTLYVPPHEVVIEILP
jgi:hypothetical protein